MWLKTDEDWKTVENKILDDGQVGLHIDGLRVMLILTRRRWDHFITVVVEGKDLASGLGLIHLKPNKKAPAVLYEPELDRLLKTFYQKKLEYLNPKKLRDSARSVFGKRKAERDGYFDRYLHFDDFRNWKTLVRQYRKHFNRIWFYENGVEGNSLCSPEFEGHGELPGGPAVLGEVIDG